MFKDTKSIVTKTLQIVVTAAVLGALSASAETISFHSPVVDAADQGDENTLLRYIRQGYPVDGRGDFEVTPLMRAAYRGNARFVRILLRMGAQADAHDISGTTALHLAARQGHEGIIQTLTEYGADVNTADEEGWTPLMRAALANKPRIMKLLIEKGADPSQVNELNESVLVHAVESGNVAAVEVLMDSGAIKTDEPEIQSVISLSLRKGSNNITHLLRKLIENDEQESLAENPLDDNALRGEVLSETSSDEEKQRGVDVEKVEITDIPALEAQDESETPPFIAKEIEPKAVKTSKKPAFLAHETVNASLTEDEFNQLQDSRLKKETAILKETAQPKAPALPKKTASQEVDAILNKNQKESSFPIPLLDHELETQSFSAPEPVISKPRVKDNKIIKKSAPLASTAPAITTVSKEASAPQTRISAPTVAEKANTEPFFTLQLGAYQSQNDASKAWDRLQNQHPDLLAKKEHAITNNTLAGARNALTIYQVRGGKFKNKRKAQQLCNTLWRREVDCFVMKTYASSPTATASAMIAKKETTPIARTVKKPTTPTIAPPQTAQKQPPAPAAPVAITPPITVAKANIPAPLEKPARAAGEKDIADDAMPWLDAKKALKAAEIEAAAILASSKHKAALQKQSVAMKKKERPSSPPRQQQKRKATVKIAEAIRIPPSGRVSIPTTSRRRPKRQNTSLPAAYGNQNHASILPPKSRYWVQIGNFPTQKMAINFAQMIRKGIAIKGLRLRVVKLKAALQQNEPAIAIQLGKFLSLAKAKSLCADDLSYMRCTVIKDIKAAKLP